MGFQIVKAEMKTARMIQWFSGICQSITDFVVGSKIRTKFEAVAVELEAMDFAWYQSLTKAIPTSIYQTFNFTLRPATYGNGMVTFSASPPATSDITITKGTKVATVSSSTQPEIVYTVNATVVLAAGSGSVSVPVLCSVSGPTGNVGSGSITVLKQTIAGITVVSNPTAMTGGAAQETEAQRQTRFQEFIVALRRGTNSAIAAGAKTAYISDSYGNITEQVLDSLVDEPTTPTGTITCYAYNGFGNTSDSLVDQAQNVVDGYSLSDGTKVSGYKAAGIVCAVVKATETAQDVAIAVTAMANVDTAALTATVRSVIAEYLGSLTLGQSCLRSEIIERVQATTGVYNVTSLTTPAADVVPATGHVITNLGTITPAVT